MVANEAAQQKPAPRACRHCGEEIPSTRQRNAMYCSSYCRGTHWHRANNGPFPIKPTPLERFRSYLSEPDANGCIVWTGATFGPGGYGAFSLNGKAIGAHRASWFFTHGSMPASRLLRHTCDNRPCVNPDHLLEGEHLDNARDRVERHRVGTGFYAPKGKLTDEQVAEIRAAYRFRKVTAKDLAERFGCSAVWVYKILEGVARTEPSEPARPVGSGAA